MARSAAARDLSGNTDPAVMPLGVHATHLSNTNYSTATIACGDCHTDPDATAGTYVDKVNTAGHIDASAGAEVAFTGARATKSGAYIPGYTQPNCAVWCHDAANAAATPDWNNTAYLPGTVAKDAANCGKCHGAPPTTEATFDHAGITIGDACSGCHPHDGTASALHINGIVEASGGCDACHGYGPAIGDGKSYRTTEMEGKGAHAQHVAHLVSLWGGALDPANDQFGTGASWTNVCGVCHNGATHNMSEPIGGTGRTISIPAAYQFGPSAPVYNGVVGTSSTVNLKSCSNVSCHFKESPGWQDPATAGN